MANQKDLANGLIGTALTSVATTLVLQAGYGDSMPAVPFFLTLTPAGQLSTMGNSEIVRVTARTGDTLTIERAQKGTTYRAFSIGDIVSNSIYAAGSFDSLDVNGDIYSNGEKVTTYRPVDYSTSEQDTGQKWINGKTIYKKTYTGTLTAAAGVRLISTISSFPSVETMVKAEGWFNGGSEIVMFGSTHVNASGTINRAMAIRGDNQFVTWSDTARTNAPYAFTIYYTKT